MKLNLAVNKLEALKENIKKGIELAEEYYSTVREPVYIEAYNRYYANEEYQSKFGDLAKKSSVVFRDIMNKIEWAMPSIIRLIAGQTDIIGIQGRTAEDDYSAEILKKLINWQLQRENNGFLVFYKFAKDLLKYSYSVIKVRWEREFEEKEFEFYISDDKVNILNNGSESEKLAVLEEFLTRKRDKVFLRRVVEIKTLNIEFDENERLYKAKVKVKRLKSNKPVLENLLPWEFLYVPDSRDIDNVSFVAHKKRVKADYLLRKAKDNFFNKESVKTALESSDIDISNLERLTIMNEQQDYIYSNDENLKEVELYEIYTKMDINGDGLLEDVIVWLAGDEILRIEENITSRHCFFGASAVIESEKLEGTSFNDLIGIYQDIKTALWKQLIINIAKNNEPITFIDPSVVDVEALADGEQYIATDLQGRNIKEFIQFEPTTPLSPHILPALEILNSEEENSTGITRYNQGLDAKTLNKTATGISMIMQAANQRLELIVRIISEVALRPLFRYLVLLNQLYMDTETVVRLTNEALVVRPDDLFGEFDFVVDTSVGLGTKETQMSAMQIVGQFYPQFIKFFQIFIQYPGFYEKFRNYYKKQLELIGIKAIDEYLPTVSEIKQLQQIQGVQNV